MGNEPYTPRSWLSRGGTSQAFRRSTSQQKFCSNSALCTLCYAFGMARGSTLETLGKSLAEEMKVHVKPLVNVSALSTASASGLTSQRTVSRNDRKAFSSTKCRWAVYARSRASTDEAEPSAAELRRRTHLKVGHSSDSYSSSRTERRKTPLPR